MLTSRTEIFLNDMCIPGSKIYPLLLFCSWSLSGDKAMCGSRRGMLLAALSRILRFTVVLVLVFALCFFC